MRPTKRFEVFCCRSDNGKRGRKKLKRSQFERPRANKAVGCRAQARCQPLCRLPSSAHLQDCSQPPPFLLSSHPPSGPPSPLFRTKHLRTFARLISLIPVLFYIILPCSPVAEEKSSSHPSSFVLQTNFPVRSNRSLHRSCLA